MIIFKNGKVPSWEKMQAFGLNPKITSSEDFLNNVRIGATRALTILQRASGIAPKPELLCMIHRSIFRDAFLNSGRLAPVEACLDLSNPKLLDEAMHKIIDLDRNAKYASSLLFFASPTRRIETIAGYHAGFMNIEAFREIDDTKFVNRTVGAVVMEAQLEHCFRTDLIKREIDAESYEKALGARWDSFGSSKALRSIVKDLGGPLTNVIEFQRYKDHDKFDVPEPTHEHDH